MCHKLELVSVLAFAGTELFYFIVACVVLCFGFDMKTVLITHQCFNIAEECLHRVKAFPTSHTAPPASRLEVGKKLGGDMAGTANPN